ncbi:alpha/beta hydrolase [Roseomonas sp. NAR14]|uniref:Alpha/beta hydrolase n=1 Tax=Roseomonas acroporae TaxID=2937791 RepID=A0A9X2BZT6_9PROT|nr:alpha/beta hydrolase [Roseomonas acroporae]MCK8787410.1 alpha/beta hydrolase [Roseomonas acroporae]
MQRRAMLGALAPLAVATAAAQAQAQTQPAAGAAPPGKTYVLVHGAWGGGWIWRHTADGLRAKGHRVFTPTQTGLGERAHLLAAGITIDTFVQDIVNVIESEELRDVVLVGHSFGGMAVTGTTDRLGDRIRHLVYLDALLPENGENAIATLPQDLAGNRQRLVTQSGAGIAMPVPALDSFPLPPPLREWFGRRLRPHPWGTYTSRLTLANPVGNGRPVTYVSYTNPPLGSIEPSRQRARSKQGWTYRELPVPHDAQAAEPERIVALLDGIG